MRYGASIALMFFSLAVGLIGQSPAVSHAGAVQLDAALGDSAVVLSGPWKFHVGDNAAWGQQDFDDSDWGTIDLTPLPGPADEDLRTSGFIPGWTSNGYPGYSGYAWYRLRINVASSHGALAIKMPMDVDDAYQVFVNGRQIGEFGKFTKGRVTAYLAEPRAFRLPLEVRSGPMTIAVRMWMDSATPFNSPGSGGMHEPPVLGRVGVIMALVGMDQKDTVLGDWQRHLRDYGSSARFDGRGHASLDGPERTRLSLDEPCLCRYDS
jgi:hypothetical protein